jgi:hypothetical protein
MSVLRGDAVGCVRRGLALSTYGCTEATGSDATGIAGTAGAAAIGAGAESSLVKAASRDSCSE